MRYSEEYMRRLQQEVACRYKRLMATLEVSEDNVKYVRVDGFATRLAVDDFKNILSEIRKLK